MIVLKRPFHILVFLLVIGSLALAAVGDSITLNGDLFGRSSPDFATKSNIQSVVPSGSKATVLETKTLPSGSVGVRVKITSLGSTRGSDTASVGSETWIYHSKSNPWFTMGGSDSQELDEDYTPPKSRYGVADGEDPNLKRNRDRTKTEGSFCADCTTSSTPVPTKRNQSDLVAVRDHHGNVTYKRKKTTTTMPEPSPRVNYTSGTWAKYPEVQRYENSPITQKMINSAVNNAEDHSTSYCYRYVKNALLASGMIRSRPDGNANIAVEGLKSKGMINMLDNPTYRAIINGDPRKAPKGAVIIYGNNGRKPPHWGDTQIKTTSGYGDTKFVSDFVSSNTYLASPKAQRARRDDIPYRIIGVMIKP